MRCAHRLGPGQVLRRGIVSRADFATLEAPQFWAGESPPAFAPTGQENRMNLASLCTRPVVTVPRSATLQEAAAQMREHHIGALVVTEPRSEGDQVCGVITDRDLAIDMLARGIDAAKAPVSELLDGRLFGAAGDADVSEAIARMQEHGVRRLLIHDDAGELIGVVSFDDLLQACAEQLSGLVQVLGKEIERERQERQALTAPPRPAVLRVPASGTAGWGQSLQPSWGSPRA